MKTIAIKDLKIGDNLTDTPETKYGNYVNRTIHSIRITKNGRYVIEIKSSYKYENEKLREPTIKKFSNGAVSENTLIDLKY